MTGKRKPSDSSGKTTADPSDFEASTPATARNVTTDNDVAAEEALMARARSAWEQGDWITLAALTNESFDMHPDRGRLALLCAAGLAQSGQIDDARHYARLALGWGCPKQLIARILISGAFNTLGRVACLLDDETAIHHYFDNAMGTARINPSGSYPARIREIREKADLGLLPEAGKVLWQTLHRAVHEQRIESRDSAILKTQVELLNGALRLAQMRNQLLHQQDGSRLEQHATSQLGQDLWVLEQTKHKTGGFFVEFGATDGVLLSNTYLLETKFGWNGICAEPNPSFFEKLKKNRDCTVALDCIAGETGSEVDFVLADEYGGITDFTDADSNAERRQAYVDSDQIIRLKTISLDDFLEKHNAPKTIDYLSIDTEGSEYEILKNFPFDRWDIRLLTVEHNFTPMREDLRILLEGHGYTRTEQQWDDWYAKSTD